VLNFSFLILVILSAFCAQAAQRWKHFADPNPLSKGARVEDWPRFNGLTDRISGASKRLLCYDLRGQ